MRRCLFQRRGEAEDRHLVQLAQTLDRDDPRPAVGQRAGLVEDQRADARHRLQGLGALDQNAEMRRPRQSGDKRHRNREDQRAGRRHHEDRHRPDRVAGPPPGGERNGDRHREKPQRPAVGQPRHRRLRRLRRLDQADDAGIGAVARRAQRHEVEGLARVGRSAHRLDPWLQPRRQRFAGQRRGVEKGGAGGHPPVDRHHVALPDQQPVARRDPVEFHLLEPAVAVPPRRPRHPRQKRVHLAARPALGEAFKEGAAGIHHRDDGGRQHLAEGQRRRHRQRRDDVEPDLALPPFPADVPPLPAGPSSPSRRAASRQIAPAQRGNTSRCLARGARGPGCGPARFPR